MQPFSHHRIPLWLLLPCLLGACGEQARPPRPAALTWFSVGEGGPGAEDGLLSLDPYPRWFVGRAEQVSEAELARRRAAAGITVSEASLHDAFDEGDDEPGRRWIAVPPPRPRRVEDLPTTQAGARLDLGVTRVGANELQLELTLHAGARALWRELQHRAVNHVPFLIGLDVDGVPVRVLPTGSAHQGGLARFEALVAAGESRRWTLRVRRVSVKRVIGTGTPKAVGFVAVFSERQHTGWAADDGEHPTPDSLLELPFEGEPVLVRSARVAVPWR